ncbi:MAG TPA: S8 family serine peptidase [Bacteroidota bacterium]|nr:S8 family serine peptidase [Bacteroidota bacterium]
MKHTAALLLLLPLAVARGGEGAAVTARLQDALARTAEGETVAAWVYFADKGSASAPTPGLVSDRALRRRAASLPANMLVDETDIPVDAGYIARVAPLVSRVRQVSHWLNAVSVDVSPASIPLLRALPFVRTIDLVLRYRRDTTVEKASPAGQLPSAPRGTTALNYGFSLGQLAPENIPAVHATGNSAQGIIIGLFDNGVRLQTHQAFDTLRPRIIAQRDFVDHKTSVVPNNPNAAFGSHGVNTLSTLGGYYPGQIIGPAFGASFILARTENDSSETPIEEDNWAAAIEWAESLGVQVTSTSLGYLTFDPPYASLSWQDMDGKTAVITRAAVMAARKGVIVVNSAGNEGAPDPGENSLIAPADADSILTAGAVSPGGIRTGFSSCGPTADGRIKPDVMAVGSGIYVASPTDTAGYEFVQGTSFSCPLTAGVAALVLKAHPEASAMQIIRAIKTTAYRGTGQAVRPDNYYGWGIVDAMAAINYLGGGSHPGPPVALAGSNTTSSSFTAAWQSVTGASGYTYDVAADTAFAAGLPAFVNRRVDFDVTSAAITGLTPATKYFYRVRAIGTGGTSGYSNTVSVSTIRPVPVAFTLSRNYPNPFNPSTRIEFEVPEQSRVTITVFDVMGRRVRTLINASLPASGTVPYFVVWDGTNDAGVRMGSGAYFYRMQATGISGRSSRQSMRMMLVR